jgi:SM-20-related protein
MEVFNLHQQETAKQLAEQQNHNLFSQIASDLTTKGYSIQPFALPLDLSNNLLTQVLSMSPQSFVEAGIGRAKEHMRNDFVRRDEICWINGNSQAGASWLEWTAKLQSYLNQHLFLGLFSFESHFAHYSAGSFYKRHVDAFKGEANRVLSVVAYLNSDWQIDDGGELVLYKDEFDMEGLKVIPALGTLAIFLSEEFPHEVLPAQRDRYSIAGWYRINASSADRVDPPR